MRKRLARVARVQEGEVPAENPSELLAEAERIFARMLDLITAINRANARAQFPDKGTLADALAERDISGKRRDFLSSVAEAASTRQDRYSKSEVKFVATVPVSQLRQQIDLLSKRFRELDTQIQEWNWKIDLD